MNAEQTLRHFHARVKNMRLLQKEYFRVRQIPSSRDEALRASKAAEKEVDQAIVELDRLFPQRPLGEQTNLFGATKSNENEQL